MAPNRQKLIDLVGTVYEAAGDATFWESFLGKLAQTAVADSAALVMHHFGHEVHTVSAGWMVDPEATRLYQEHYGSLDVWAIRGRSKPVGTVCASESLCLHEEFVKTGFYNDFMARYGIVHGMFGLVENSSTRWASLSLFRSSRAKEFRPSDLEIIDLLIPHIRRAFKLHFQLSELEARTTSIERALDMLSAGIIFVGVYGQVVLMNSTAERLVRREDGLSVVQGKLRALRHGESERLQAMIAGAIRTSAGKGLSAGGTLFISRATRRPLSITVAPLRHLHVGLGQRPCAVLFLSNPDENVELPIDLLRRCYGLTAAEARLTMVLLEGRSLKEATDSCNVTRNTAKSQLKSIFLKTEVQRQSELVRLLLKQSPVSGEASCGSRETGA
jgi:DNA-binding CsgD family transcriptional regulator